MATPQPSNPPALEHYTRYPMCDKTDDEMIAHAQPVPNRRLRPIERQPMKDWLLDLLDNNVVSSLSWIDKGRREFRIKWCHGSRHGWSLRDADLFERWAKHTGRYLFGGKQDPKRWKANFRCALNSLKTIEEIRDKSYVKGSNACRIYRIKDDVKRETKFPARRAQKTQQYQTRGMQQKQEIKYEETSADEAMMNETCVITQEEDNMTIEIKPQTTPTVPPPSTTTTTTTAYETKTETGSCLPNFDKISPGIDHIEFGKMHSRPNHSCGVTVKKISPSPCITNNYNNNNIINNTISSSSISTSTSQPLPSLGNFTISLPDSFQAQIVAGASYFGPTSGPASTPVRPQPQYQQPSYVYPESPEASDASPQSAMQEDELVEVSFVEVSEEVEISSQETEEQLVELTNLNWQPIEEQYQVELVNVIAASQQHNADINAWTHGYCPLTPP